VDDLVYTRFKKSQASTGGSADLPSDHESANRHFKLPTLAELQEKQRSELLEIAQVRFGIKGGAVDILLTPLKIDSGMSEAQVFKVLMTAPEHERADQVLYELAKGNLDGHMANRILASLALLGKFKKMKVD
jgi:hypothetical protein